MPYGPLTTIIGVAAVWPFRYHISEYFERQREGPHIEIRRKAVQYYQEIERMHRRQAMVNQENLWDDNMPHRNTANISSEAMRKGFPDMEQSYWLAHQRDAMRAEKLLQEVRALKAKVGADGAQ